VKNFCPYSKILHKPKILSTNALAYFASQSRTEKKGFKPSLRFMSEAKVCPFETLYIILLYCAPVLAQKYYTSLKF
jgi:hypothetical protein